MNYKFSQIFADRQTQEDPITRQVLKHYAKIPIQWVEEGEPVIDTFTGLKPGKGKKTLWLTRFKGSFLKPCPGTAPPYRCCNYLVINETTNCPIDCSYCVLQGYINNPVIKIYTNFEKIQEEIRAISQCNPQRILRVGTGELTDSLALDPVTGLSRHLILTVQELSNIFLELKTKTDHIDHLLPNNPEKVILSWSVNPGTLVDSDERKAVGVLRRLKAARRVQRFGYLVGLHIDPIIYYSDWQNGYQELVGQISRNIDPEQIAWISLGSLRFPPQLKDIIRARFPHSNILAGEQIRGLDGKIRYLRPLRLRMYRAIAGMLQQALGDIFIYFCMESQDIWQRVLNLNPADNLEIDWYFARHISQHFPDLGLPRPRRDTYRHPVLFPQGTA